MLMNQLAEITAGIQTRSISPENFTGEPGQGGRATEGTGANCARDLGQGWKVSPSVKIEPGQTFVLADIKGEGAIRHIWITDPPKQQRSSIIRFYWDGSEIPSVEVPLWDFFAAAGAQDYAQLTSIPVCVNPQQAFNCYWEMPFYSRCKITLENQGDRDSFVYYQIDYELKKLSKESGYFHAMFNRSNPVQGGIHTIADHITGRGKYVGTYLYMGMYNNGWWGEGEIKFYMDNDTEFPTICGTGTEDYICGSMNFDVEGRYTPFCTPYAGLAAVSPTDGAYKAVERFSLYRWHICDPIYFEKGLRVTLQDLGWKKDGRYHLRQDDISSVCYWYQDTICKTRTPLPGRDELEII